MKELQNLEIDSKIQFPDKTDRFSKDVFLIPLDQKGTTHALILMEWLSGSSPDCAWIITKGGSGFHSEQKLLREQKLGAIRDYNGDGKFDLLVRGGMGEPGAVGAYSYDPYLVYVQVSNKRAVSFKFDEALSKKWSEENHYEWHGNHYNENFEVDSSGKIIGK